MIDLLELTIDNIHEAYRAQTFTCRELVQAYLIRIEALDANGPKVNSILARSTIALHEADILDSLWKTSGKCGALHGIPIIVKDQAETKGITTTYGSIVAKDNVPEEDATVITKLKAAGAIILAKSTLCDFAAGWFSTSSLSGTTRNPYDLEREPGGSSAGTGAAIAANFGTIGLGEDTGGSIRIPASFCGLVGLRPSVGLISRKGMSPLLVPQDTAGPMTRTVRDAALMLDAMAGFDAGDAYTATAAIAGSPTGGSYAANLDAKIIGPSLRIGILKQGFGDDSDPNCHATNIVTRQALEKLGEAGTTLIDVEIPRLEHYLDFTSMFKLRVKHDIDNFLATKPHLNTNLVKIGAEKLFHPALDLISSIAAGISSPHEDPTYSRRLEERNEFQRLVMSIMISNNLDAIAFPDIRIPAPLTQDVLDMKYTENGTPTNTVIASFTYLPAISIPVGLTRDKSLPVGLEFMGMPYQEQKLLEIGYGVEQLIQGRQRPPAPF